MGSALGSLRDLFTKVKSIDAKHGKFDLVLCTGDFFGAVKDEDTVDEESETYQLLEGKLEGVLHSLHHFTLWSDECVMSGAAPPTVLHYARRATSSYLCNREVRKNEWGALS